MNLFLQPNLTLFEKFYLYQIVGEKNHRSASGVFSQFLIKFIFIGNNGQTPRRAQV
jgi:hypothetical protein